jgi:mono/diheme cytochrome c family protein
MRISLWSFRGIALGCILSVTSLANAGPAIPGFDRFHADKPDAAGGRLLIGELNCVACHKAQGAAAAAVEANPAPSLSDAGLRLKPEWVRQYIKNPHASKPGTRMPGPPHGIPEATIEEHTEALLHYVMSLQSGKAATVQGKAQDGARIFNSIGCAACHAPIGKESEVKSDKATVPLPDLKAKYINGPALAAFLLDPHKYRPGGRMPKLNLTNDEAVSIAAAFGLAGLAPTSRVGVRNSDDEALKKAGLTTGAGGDLQTGIGFALYSGNWSKLPPFDTLKPKETGNLKKFDISKMNDQDNFAYRFRGYLEIPRDGVYTFSVHSDDGSRLTIGRDVVVESDTIQAGTEKSGSIELKKGLHAITVDYFEAQGGEELRVSIEGPKVPKQEVPGGILFYSKSGKFVIGEDAKPAKKVDDFVPDPAQVGKGRALFTVIGCIACHGNPDKNPQAASAGGPLIEPKPLSQLKNSKGKGCLSEKPTGFAQNYALTKAQIDAIDLAIAEIDTALVLTPAQAIDRTLTTLNCYACHSRGDKGGPEEGHRAQFTGTYQDLADEGRLPPHLGDVGAKLTKAWLTQIVTQGTKVRPYMNTRMPVFGSMVNHLPDDFEKAEAVDSVVKVPLVTQKDAVKHGRTLVGTGGMSCVSCHVYAGEKSLGLPAMDLAYMPQRLKREWFGRYLLDPAKLRPGTRMPQFWPQGKSVRQDILEGDTAAQVEHIWQYLSLGGKAPLPQGLARAGMLLTAETEAIIYRNFIAGAGPRAIGVGYPEKVNLAWDANTLRPAMIWQGDFIDASKHWIDRGSGFQGPAGFSVVNLPDGPPLATLSSQSAEWPQTLKKNNVVRAEGFDFKGYSLDKLRRPTFMYVMGAVRVNEFYEGVATKEASSLKRTLTVEGAPENMYARLAAGTIETVEGGFKVNKDLVIKVTGDGKAIVRTAGNKQELVVPVKAGQATITVEYVW